MLYSEALGAAPNCLEIHHWLAPQCNCHLSDRSMSVHYNTVHLHTWASRTAPQVVYRNHQLLEKRIVQAKGKSEDEMHGWELETNNKQLLKINNVEHVHWSIYLYNK